MKECLLTGCTGLIGREVLALLQGGGWITYALVRNKSRNDSESVRFVCCDFSGEWTAAGFPRQIDAVIHLAQSEHFRNFPEYADDIFSVNTRSTVRLLDYARRSKAGTFVLASSGGVYGHGHERFKEDEPIVTKSNLGFYLGTKLTSEVLAESYTPYLNVISLRFFFVYGPGQRSTMLIPRLVHCVREGQPILLHSQKGIKLNPTYVADAALSVRRSLELGGSHKINVAGPEILTLRSIGEQIGEAVGREPKFEIKKDVRPQDLIGDVRKMSELLHAPGVRFGEGIRKTICRDETAASESGGCGVRER